MNGLTPLLNNFIQIYIDQKENTKNGKRYSNGNDGNKIGYFSLLNAGVGLANQVDKGIKPHRSVKGYPLSVVAPLTAQTSNEQRTTDKEQAIQPNSFEPYTAVILTDLDILVIHRGEARN